MRRFRGLLTLVLAVSASWTLSACFEPEPDACTSGETRPDEDGCNTCTCDDGQWSCTEMACAECAPGEHRDADDGCNTCECTEDGTWACTRLACECTTGETTDAGDGCNTCTCLEDGSWACTAMACLECAPGETRMDADGCACVCDTYGMWACDEGCEEPCTPGETLPYIGDCECICSLAGEWSCPEDCSTLCVPGETRPADDGCNTCTCVGEGSSWACTEMACGDECLTDADCFVGGCSGQLCTGEPDMGSTCEWRDEYACYDDALTSCGCFAGHCGWEPTEALEACLSEPPCEPGDERAMDACNSCYCMDDGTWACTGMICPECTPGDTMAAEDGCDCLCEEPGYWACDADCAPTCVPGETREADDGCNTCTCTADGGWACTEMACAPVVCETDADCVVTGCSGQLCAAEPMDSTCEWLDEYACYDDAHCGCFDGVCHWEETDALLACIGE